MVSPSAEKTPSEGWRGDDSEEVDTSLRAAAAVTMPGRGDAGAVEAPGVRARSGSGVDGRWRLVALGGAVLVGTVLRCWRLGAGMLSFDEAFTAAAARLPLGRLLAYLRHHDSHPPLDYLIRRPAALSGASALWLRLPSALCGVAALGVGAWWWRRHGRVGVVTTWLFALSSFAVTYAHEARMYAGLGLAGITAAAAAERWLEEPDRIGPLVAVTLALLGALLLQGGAGMAVFGVIAVAGGRRDAAAWRWRGAVVCAVAGWGICWGPAFLAQLRHGPGQWIPLTSLTSAPRAVNELVDSYPSLALVAVPMVVLGGMLLRPAPLRRVWWTVGAGSMVVPLAVGLHAHVLLPRTMAFGAWAPALAMAAVIDAAVVRSRPVAAGVASLVLAVAVPSAIDAARPEVAPHAAAFAAVRRAARPGDEVLVRPAFLAPLVDWYFGTWWWPGGRDVQREDIHAAGTTIGGGAPSGRAWVVVPVSYPGPSPGVAPCAPPAPADPYTVYCISDAH